jgi:hypothetical protein
VLGTLYRYPHPLDAMKFIYVGQGAKRDRAHRRGKEGFGRRFKKEFPNTELPQPIRGEVEVIDNIHLNHLETAWMIVYRTWFGLTSGMNLRMPSSSDYKNLATLAGMVTHAKGVGIFAPEHLGKAGRALGSALGRRLKREKRGIFAPDMLGRGGRKTAENGQLARTRELPQTKEGQRRAGRMAGHRTKENGTGIFAMTHEEKSAAGRAGGRKGGLIGGRIAGPVNGRKAVVSGQVFTLLHIRWHVNPNRGNPRCALCSEQGLVVAYA